MDKVGIIILHYNSSRFLELTLRSIADAKTAVNYEIIVVDNNSSSDQLTIADTAVSDFNKPQKNRARLIPLAINKGFSGGNNVAIEMFLLDPFITHICLLNSDVVVGDFWLDYLLKYNVDVIGPVTNAAGNEQTIPVDIAPEQNSSGIPIINSFAQKRWADFENSIYRTDLVTFFATVFKRKVIKRVGLLDERFSPGSFEDDDYCIRILQSGFEIWIARGCYIHHWGSGSFTQLAMDTRIDISQKNKARFEEKWNCKWQDRRWKLIESCKQDVEYLLKDSNVSSQSKNLISQGFLQSEKMISELVAHQFFLEGVLSSSNPESQELRQTVALLQNQLAQELPLKTNIQQISKKIARRLPFSLIRSRLNVTQQNAKQAAIRIEKFIQHSFLQAKREGVAQQLICVFAPIFRDENITDGYFQRVKAIDEEILLNFYKIYINCVPALDMPQIELIDRSHIELRVDLSKADQKQLVSRIIFYAKKIYFHSAFRLMPNVVPAALRDTMKKAKIFWDVHGSLPEEFALHNDDFSAQLAGEAEEFLMQNATAVIVVNKAMQNHLQAKYPNINSNHRFIVLPIMNKALLNSDNSNALKSRQYSTDKPTTVYAGGLQKWQKIGQMQKIMHSAINFSKYKIFVPDPKAFLKSWEESGNAAEEIYVAHKTPAEVFEEYSCCDFGFILRDPIVVNKVACPTKLIEYLQHGIIPIMDTSEIGDFVALGMKYISHEDFAEGVIPDNEQCYEIAKNNYAVLEKLAAMGQVGKEELSKIIIEG